MVVWRESYESNTLKLEPGRKVPEFLIKFSLKTPNLNTLIKTPPDDALDDTPY
jgi:hypothetical protein